MFIFEFCCDLCAQKSSKKLIDAAQYPIVVIFGALF